MGRSEQTGAEESLPSRANFLAEFERRANLAEAVKRRMYSRSAFIEKLFQPRNDA